MLAMVVEVGGIATVRQPRTGGRVLFSERKRAKLTLWWWCQLRFQIMSVCGCQNNSSGICDSFHK